MFNETVTIYIDDTSIRLLVSQGQRIRKWADVQLEPGLVKSSAVAEDGEVSARIKQLLQSQGVTTRKVSLCYSGLHSLTRPIILPQLPKAMIPEAVAREARRILPVPLDQLYLSWRMIPSPEGRIQVFLVTTPRKTADSLVQALRSAGLEPTRMAIKPLVLTRALSDDSAILVDVQPAEFDLVILVDGIPQPIRTVSLPNRELTWEQKLDMIVSDLERTINFFDTNNPEKPLPASLPIYISGELVNNPEYYQSLSEKIGHPVKTLTPNLKGPEQIDLGRYMVNIAMAMKPSTPSNGAAFSIANLNLLPAPYQPKPISFAKAFGIPGSVAVVGLVVPMVMMIQTTSTSIASKQIELDATNQQINQKNAQKLELKKSVTDLETKAKAVKKTYDTFNASWNLITSQQEYVSGDLAIVLGSLTPDITLSKVNLAENTLILSGTAPNQEDLYSYAQAILQYARSLDLSSRYQETTVSKLSTTFPKPTNSTNNGGQDNASSPEDGSNQENIDTQENQSGGKIEFVLTFERRGK